MHLPAEFLSRSVARPFANVGLCRTRFDAVGEQPDAGYAMKPEAIEIVVERFCPTIRFHHEKSGPLGCQAVSLSPGWAFTVSHDLKSVSFAKDRERTFDQSA